MNAFPPDAGRLMDAIDATWPAAEILRRGGWTLRRGAGGGQRVSAARSMGRGMGDIAEAEAGMRAWGQEPIFSLTRSEAELDALLAARGYVVHDPVALYAAPVESLAKDADETVRLLRCESPLALVDEIWAVGGIGPGRRAVMMRCTRSKTILIARTGDHLAGCAFVAVDGGVAMIHAIEVWAGRRRCGAGTSLLRSAARWAGERGAKHLALAVTEANVPANALYRKLGMAIAGHYHYRVLPGKS